MNSRRRMRPGPVNGKRALARARGKGKTLAMAEGSARLPARRLPLPPLVSVHFPTLIARKRDGQPLAPGAWRASIAAYLDGGIPEYQMAAMLMAVVWRGLTDAELAELTLAMLESGERARPAAGSAPILSSMYQLSATFVALPRSVEKPELAGEMLPADVRSISAWFAKPAPCVR